MYSLDKYNLSLEKEALEKADLLLEAAQDQTRGGTNILNIRQLIYSRLKQIDLWLKAPEDQASAQSGTDSTPEAQEGPSGNPS